MITVDSYDVLAPDGRVLLKQFSAKIFLGERVALTGPNGCGKTTLLRQIAGLMPRNERSSIHIDHARISYIPTRPLDLVLPWATLEKNLEIFALNANESIRTVRDSFSNFATLMNLDSNTFYKMTIYKMSSGQQAMSAIFCALIQRPSLLIADEIFSTLAEIPRIKIAEWLRHTNLTVICASHDEDFIDSLGARRIRLDNYIV